MAQDGAAKDRHAIHLLSRLDNRLGSVRRGSLEGHCLLDGVDHHLYLCLPGGEGRRLHRRDAEVRCHRDVAGHCRLGGEVRCHRDVAGHYRLDEAGRCRLLDVVDHRDAGVRLDVKNCLDLGVRSWKAESAGDRGR